MEYSIKTGLLHQRKVVISVVWVFVLMNMIYADILNTLKPGYLEGLEEASKNISGEMVLGFAVLMEIPIIMILLSRVLRRKANRIANLIAAPIAILWVILPAFLISEGGATPLSYMFFATVEVIAMLFIMGYAWQWPKEKFLEI
ncbi:hypothetical protein BKI52_07230 [marine bacterium AO1-C]|nr:hypothetical protein BKI52_07230 [marine bacterium AO1-C]